MHPQQVLNVRLHFVKLGSDQMNFGLRLLNRFRLNFH